MGVTLVGALFLAATASSAPLSSFWRNMDDQLVSLVVEINRFVGGVTGVTRQAGGLFGSAETIRGVWVSSAEPVFSACCPPAKASTGRAPSTTPLTA